MNAEDQVAAALRFGQGQRVEVIHGRTVLRFPKSPLHARHHRLARRDGWWCRYCRCALVCACNQSLPVARATSDHVVPRRAGGSNVLPNLVLSCGPCNSRKGGDLPQVIETEPGSYPTLCGPL